MHDRDVTTGKIYVRPLRWWAESALPGWDRVKVSENLGATAVAPVAPVVTSLNMMVKSGLEEIFLKFLHAQGLFQVCPVGCLSLVLLN